MIVLNTNKPYTNLTDKNLRQIEQHLQRKRVYWYMYTITKWFCFLGIFTMLACLASMFYTGGITIHSKGFYGVMLLVFGLFIFGLRTTGQVRELSGDIRRLREIKSRGYYSQGTYPCELCSFPTPSTQRLCTVCKYHMMFG